MSSTVLFSVAPDYYRAAVAELRRSLPVDRVRRVGEDAGELVLGRGGQPETAAACWSTDVRFVRHLAAVDASLTTPSLQRRDDGSPQDVADWALDTVEERLEPGEEISLHVWDSGHAPYAPGSVRRPLLEGLLDLGVRVVTSGADRVLSVCLGEERSTVGLGRTEHGLSDWAGGRVRLAARKEQISRAEFKLEELFGVIGAPQGETALDLGASPGGWTRILRTHGFRTVHAVDPADLDERLRTDPGVVHHRTTAGELLHEMDDRVDLVVNDMRMVPHLTAHTMVDAAHLLSPGGQAVVTFKLGTSNPVKQADESLAILDEAYDPTFIRQLQHNRHELTVVATRR